MGRMMRPLAWTLAALSMVLLMTCENPLLALIEYKVAKSKGDPNIVVTYKGAAVAPGATVDIGNAVSGGAPKSVGFTIENSGRVQLVLSGSPLIVIGGANAAMFSLSTLPYASIAPSTNSPFFIEFAPTSVGLKTATMTISSDDPDTGTFTCTVNGRGVSTAGPDIEVSQGGTVLDAVLAYDFGAIRAGTTKSAVFTISNVGTPGSTLNLAATTVVITGAQFTLFAQPTPLALIEGASTTFTVTFSPPAAVSAQSYTATMRIYSDDSDEGTYTVSLSGSGEVPIIEVNQGLTPITDGGAYGTSLGSIPADGPNLQVGSDVTFTLHNTGSWLLSISSCTLTGTNSVDFDISSAPASSVAAGGQTSFSVRFDPLNPGTRSATVSIVSDAPGTTATYTFDISGDGTFVPKVYWVGYQSGEIYRANLDGSNMEVILAGLSSPTGLAIHQTNNRMYFGLSGSIGMADLDGANFSEFSSISPLPYGVAVDGTNVYWISNFQSTMGKVGRALLDGTSATQQPSTSIIQGWGIAVDPSSTNLYSTSYTSGNVCLCNKIALNYPTTINNMGSPGLGMAFDEINGTLYSTCQGGPVYRFFPSGTIAISGAVFIALDVMGNHIYWTKNSGEVCMAALDGSNQTTIAFTSYGAAYGIALDLTN
jgi:hypothetical protein